MIVYYNNNLINVTKFAQHCVTLDQQIRAYTAKQKRANKKTEGQGNKRKKTVQEPDDSKTKKPGDNKEKPRFVRDYNTIKYYNCDRLEHIAKDCCQLRQEDKLIIA